MCRSQPFAHSLSRTPEAHNPEPPCQYVSPHRTCQALPAGYQSLYEVPRSRGADVKYWQPRYNASTAQHAGDCGRLAFDVADLRALIDDSPNLALVAVNFPHNPTGAVLPEADMRAAVDAVCGRGAWLFSDEMYRGLGAPVRVSRASRCACFWLAALCARTLPSSVAGSRCGRSVPRQGPRDSTAPTTPLLHPPLVPLPRSASAPARDSAGSILPLTSLG